MHPTCAWGRPLTQQPDPRQNGDTELNDDPRTPWIADDEPAWLSRPWARIRVGEAEVQEVYPVLLAAEKAAFEVFFLARERGAPDAQQLRQRARRLERHRRKYLDLIEEMGWNLPL